VVVLTDATTLVEVGDTPVTNVPVDLYRVLVDAETPVTNVPELVVTSFR